MHYTMIRLILVVMVLAACSPETIRTTETQITPTSPASFSLTPDPSIILTRGNPQRTGVYPSPAIRTQPQVRWQVKAGSSLMTPPLVADGMLYSGSFSGKLHALNAETGEQVWVADGFGHLESTGAIAGDQIVSGGFGRLVRALDRNTGGERWSFKTDYPIQGAPLIVENRVYIATDRAVYALDLESGQLAWKIATGSEEAYMGAPAYDDGVIYTTGGKLLLALDAHTGKELWRVEKTDPFLSLAVADQLVYVGSWDHHLYAFDQATGEERWKFKTGGEVLTPPAVDDGAVYAGSLDQMLYALDGQTGELRWSFETGDRFVSAPLIVGDVIYVTDSNHEVRSGPRHLYALDAATGEQLWMFEIESRFLPTPALGDQTIYLITAEEILALE